MKKVFRRIYLEYKENTITKFIQGSVYFLVFIMLLSSFFISNLSSLLENHLSKSLDFHVIIGSSLNNGENADRWKIDGSRDLYVEQINDYLDNLINIGNTSNCYYDMTVTPMNFKIGNYFSNPKTFLIHNDSIKENDNLLNQLVDNFEQYKEFLIVDIKDSDDLFNLYQNNPNIKASDIFNENAFYKLYSNNGAYWNINAVCSTNFLSLKLNNISITKGSPFVEEQLRNGENVCIMKEGAFIVVEEDNTYRKKRIEVGDTIPLNYNLAGFGSGEISYKEMLFTVVGLYKENVEQQESDRSPIYIPFNCWKNIWNESYAYIKENNLKYMYQFHVSNCYYETDNLADLNNLMNVIKENKTETMSYVASTGDNVNLLGCISAISSNLNNISIIIIVLSLLFITVCLYLENHYLKPYHALLTELGESRFSILLQEFYDTCIKIMVSFPLAIICSKIITIKLFDNLLHRYINDTIILNQSSITLSARQASIVLSCIVYVYIAKSIIHFFMTYKTERSR